MTVMQKVRAGDVVTLEHPNGDRIGPRVVESISSGAAFPAALYVTKVGDFDPSSREAAYARHLRTLLRAGWVVTTINGEPTREETNE